jgi:hypothetical protein
MRVEETSHGILLPFSFLMWFFDMGSRRLHYMSLHFSLSLSFPTLILERLGQAEDGAHPLFSSSLSYPPLRSFQRDNRRLFLLMNWKTSFAFFFSTIDRDRERRLRAFHMFLLFHAASMLQFRGTDYKTGTALSLVWLGMGYLHRADNQDLAFGLLLPRLVGSASGIYG